jgi:hypothetical protein
MIFIHTLRARKSFFSYYQILRQQMLPVLCRDGARPVSTGTVRVQYGYSTGTVRVQYGYNTGTIRVQYGYNTGTVRVQYVYSKYKLI